MEKYIKFKTQKRNKAKNDFEEDFYELFNNAIYGKTMEKVRSRIKREFILKKETDKIIKQSKLTLNGIHKSYTNYDSYTFEQNEVVTGKPTYLGFALLELSKILMYETYYDKLQPYLGQKNLQLHYMDTDSFVSSVDIKDIIKDLKKLYEFFDPSNLNESQELFSNKNKKVIGKFKNETPKKNSWIDKFVCLRSKMYAFICADDYKIKLKGVSKSYFKNIRFEEYEKRLDDKKYQQECDNYDTR